MRLTVRSTISCSDRRRLLAPKKHPRSARYGGVGFAVFGATLFVAAGASVAAQAPSPAPGETPLSVVFDRTTVDALPATVNLFSFLETTQADVVTDRFFGGVNGAAVGRLGVFLAPLGQTNFRVGDVDVTSPVRGGPLFVPPVPLWRGLTVTSGLVPSDTSGPGLLVALEPESPSPTWQGSFQASGTAEPLVSTTSRLGSPIARTAGFGSISGAVGGPVVRDRVGLLLSASTLRASQYERGGPSAASQRSDTVSSHVVFTPRREDVVRLLAWRQAGESPAFPASFAGAPSRTRSEASTHVQGTWEPRVAGGTRWRMFAALTQRSWEAAEETGTVLVERLIDGAPSDYAAAGQGRERTSSVGWRMRGPTGRAFAVLHALEAGFTATRASLDDEAESSIDVRERVGGFPARVWQYASRGPTHRSALVLNAYLSDAIRLSRSLTLDAAVHLDRSAGSARGATQDIAWTTILPRVGVRWRASERVPTVAYAAYTHLGDALRLDALAYGDPAAPVADVLRWDGVQSGPLVMRVGPGAGNDAALTSIDPGLQRPITRELALGIDSTLPHLLRVRATMLYQRRSQSLAAFNAGVPLSSYLVRYLDDPGANLEVPDDDVQLPVYERLPATFGQDRYVLANSTAPPATLRGLTVLLDKSTPRFFFSLGGAMGWTHGEAGQRGFGPEENDAGVIGELYTTPNATTFARGNLFADRQFTVRIASVMRLPHEVTVGAIARYQDGQAFSRMVVVPDLAQGTDAVRAFRSGKSRFTFTGTFDLRVQKALTLAGRRQVNLFVDAFNLLNMDKEVEEWVATGAMFRTPTATQPPRNVHLGVRVTF
jgi:hypothetical protein